MKPKSIEFTVIPLGYLENDMIWNFAPNIHGTIMDKNPKAQWWRVPVLAILIKHPDAGYILFDTGTAQGDDNELRRPEESRFPFPLFVTQEDLLFHQLKKLGLSPNDISTIVISHMHWDHCGGLEIFSDTQAGQNVYAPMHDFAHGLVLTHRRPEFFDDSYNRLNFEVPGITYNLIEDDQELAPGIEMVMLGGHTPGVIGLVVHTETGTWIFPSDSVYTRRNYGPPIIRPGILYDSLGFDKSIQKLYRLEKKYNARFIFPHDPVSLAELKLAPYFYGAEQEK